MGVTAGFAGVECAVLREFVVGLVVRLLLSVEFFRMGPTAAERMELRLELKSRDGDVDPSGGAVLCCESAMGEWRGWLCNDQKRE